MDARRGRDFRTCSMKASQVRGPWGDCGAGFVTAGQVLEQYGFVERERSELSELGRR